MVNFMSKPKNYRTARIPSDVFNRVEEYIQEHPEFGYSSVANFITDSIRMNMRLLNEEIKLRKKK